MISEPFALLASVLCGVFSVLLWGAVDALRDCLKSRTVLDIILDIFWWVTAVAVFCVSLWYTANMRFRAFEFIGVIFGAILCCFTLLRPVKLLFSVVFQIILKIIKFIFKILLTPWAFLYKILIVPIIRVLCLKTRKVANDDSPEKHIG